MIQNKTRVPLEKGQKKHSAAAHAANFGGYIVQLHKTERTKRKRRKRVPTRHNLRAANETPCFCVCWRRSMYIPGCPIAVGATAAVMLHRSLYSMQHKNLVDFVFLGCPNRLDIERRGLEPLQICLGATAGGASLSHDAAATNALETGMLMPRNMPRSSQNPLAAGRTIGT